MARGRKLLVPPGRAVRPSPDRVREALFSILADRCLGARVLDACAGTGALGLEALSRGAARVLFVERDRLVAEALRANVARCGLDGAELVVGDVVRLLPALAASGERFDLVLVDPPHADDAPGAVASAVAAAGVVAPGGLVVVEHAAAVPPRLVGLHPVDRRRYGTVGLVLCETGS